MDTGGVYAAIEALHPIKYTIELEEEEVARTRRPPGSESTTSAKQPGGGEKRERVTDPRRNSGRTLALLLIGKGGPATATAIGMSPEWRDRYAFSTCSPTFSGLKKEGLVYVMSSFGAENTYAMTGAGKKMLEKYKAWQPAAATRVSIESPVAMVGAGAEV